MSRKDSLVLYLCLEDPSNCHFLLSQIGGGHIFGENQHVKLMLQGSDLQELEALGWEIQDCAFPLITGISTHTHLGDAPQSPDAVIVHLSDRPDHLTFRNNSRKQQDLLGLVHYTSNLVDMLVNCSLDRSPVVILGDLAHTAASLVSTRLAQLDIPIGAGQLVALDGAMVGRKQGQMSKRFSFCQALSQWTAGSPADHVTQVFLGSKFVDTSQSFSAGKENTGYFFSAPVEFSGPMTFRTATDLCLDADHVASVKAQTDKAYELVSEVMGHRWAQTNSEKAHAHMALL